MENQVLSIEQMRKLKELGVDTSKASMCYISKYPSCDFDDGDSIVVVSRDFNKRLYNEFGPAFTLQDLIELLPKQIINCNEIYLLKIIPISNEVSYVQFNSQICADITKYPLRVKKSDSLFNSLFEMLIWVIANGYLKTK